MLEIEVRNEVRKKLGNKSNAAGITRKIINR